MTVLENILLIQELSDGKDEARARELLALVGLEDEVNRFPAEISGGQQQRVTIARALVNNPEIVWGDEPTGNLDSTTSRDIMKVFVNLNVQGQTIIIVTHEHDIAKYARRQVHLHDGLIDKDFLSNEWRV